jgi:arylformamidase
MNVIDLTQPLNAQTPAYTDEGGYRDPSYRTEPWASIPTQGYSVHRLELGTHTGTHLDAPAHFHAQGRTVDKILASALVGWAKVIDVRAWTRVTTTALDSYSGSWRDGDLLLFVAPDAGIPIDASAVATVAEWRPKLILFSGQLFDEGERYHHNRVWLGADVPLVTDLDPTAAAHVRDGDLLMVAPLPLEGMDGAPCRVYAVQDLPLAKMTQSVVN